MSRNAKSLALAIAIVSLLSVGLEVMIDLGQHPERSVAETLWRKARFFTILTNMMLGVTFLWMVLTRRMSRAAWLAGLTLWIAIVGVVYHALLARDLSGLEWWTDHGLHTLSPILTLAFWVIYAPKRGLGLNHALAWLTWPLLYVAYALVRGAVDGTYPYFFTDPGKIGWIGVAKWTAILGGSFFVGGLGMLGLARVLR